MSIFVSTARTGRLVRARRLAAATASAGGAMTLGALMILVAPTIHTAQMQLSSQSQTDMVAVDQQYVDDPKEPAPAPSTSKVMVPPLNPECPASEGEKKKCYDFSEPW